MFCRNCLLLNLGKEIVLWVLCGLHRERYLIFEIVWISFYKLIKNFLNTWKLQYQKMCCIFISSYWYNVFKRNESKIFCCFSIILNIEKAGVDKVYILLGTLLYSWSGGVGVNIIVKQIFKIKWKYFHREGFVNVCSLCLPTTALGCRLGAFCSS